MDPEDPQRPQGPAREGEAAPGLGGGPFPVFGWTPARPERSPGRTMGPFGPFDPFEPPVPYDDEFDDEPTGRRWPLPVRAMAAVVAGSLVLAAVAGGVGIFLDGSNPSFVTTVTRMSVASIAPVKGTVQVTISVTNAGDAVGRPVCMVEVLSAGKIVGAEGVRLAQFVAPSAVVSLTVGVPLQSTAFTTPQAEAVCRPG